MYLIKYTINQKNIQYKKVRIFISRRKIIRRNCKKRFFYSSVKVFFLFVIQLLCLMSWLTREIDSKLAVNIKVDLRKHNC